MSTCNWTGISGKKYQFDMVGLNANLPAKGGVYCFCKNSSPNSYDAIYIGQTSDLSQRITSGHHKIDCISRKGATDLHVLYEGNTNTRTAIESDLLQSTKPPCNG